MALDRRKPPGGHGRLSRNSVAADGFDDFTDNSPTPRKQVTAAPLDFDPAACPIIARHFFGVGPLRPVGRIAAEVVAGLRFRRQVEHLYRLGPRVVGEA